MCACEGASPRRNVKNRYRRDVKNRTEQRKEEHLDSPRAPQPPVRRAGLRTQPKSYNLTSARQASPVSAIGAAQRSLAPQPAPSCQPPPARSAEGHGFALTVLPGRPCSCDV